ncbi:phage tail tape measure protein [Deinococcus sp. A31D244]|uniref:phage tail tape measure protein n=1 Tax=Deinococcus sp. A31D244 TaxID=3397675 RepID=UPI0039E0A45A
MPEEIIVADLLLAVDVTDAPEALIDRVVKDAQRRMDARALKLNVTIDGNTAATARAEAQATEQAVNRTAKASRDAAAASRALRAELDAQAAADRKASAARVNADREGTAAAVATTARLREQQAQLSLTTRLAQQAARDEKIRSQASINALENEMRSYRNMWQARQIGDRDVIEAQSRIHQQALLQAAAVDKTSDAYRRLTQVAAGAQRTMDSASGINTPGGFASGVHQGVLSALGNLGPFGQLAEQLAGIYQQYRAAQADMKGAGADVGRAAGDGVTEGIKSRQDEVKKAGEATGDAVEKGLKDALDIRSPSRVLRQVGIWSADGLIDGLKARYAEALQAGRTLANQVQRGAQSVNLGTAFGISGGTGLGLFSGVGSGSSAGAGGSGLGQAAADTQEAIDALNDLPAAAKQAELGAAGVEIAAEGMGGAVETAAGHVQSLKEAHQEADPAARATAVAEAENAIAFTAVTAAVGALGYALVTGAQKAAEYEQGLAEISLLTDKLPNQLGRVGRGILQVGADSNKSFGELKEAYEEILGASVKGTEDDSAALAFLARSANLAKVTREETKVAADALTSLLNAYSQDASQAGRASDLLWASISAGKVKLGEIAGSLGATAGQAASLNVPMEELLGAMALLTTRGIPASTALEYIRSALANVQKPSQDARDTAKDLGIQFDAAALKSMGLVKFLSQLGRGVGDNSEALATLIGDVGGLQAVLGLLNGGLDDTDGVMARVTDSAGSLDRQVGKLKGTAEDSVNGFNAAWERTQILFSGSVLSAFTTVLDKGVNPLLEKLGTLKSALEDAGNSPQQIRAVLTIDWAKDDATTMAYKLFFSAGQAGKEVNENPYVQVLRKVLTGEVAFRTLQYAGKQNVATGLRNQLVESGLMERAANPAERAKQVEDVMKNFDHYLQLMQEHVRKGTDTLLKRDPLVPTALAGEGPLLPGQGRTTDVSGLALAGLLGVGGRTRGTPFGQKYGPGGSWGAHVGEDFFAPVGTKVYAPFSGYAKARQDKAQGNVVDLFDAAGQRLSMIHLDKYADGLVEAIDKAGGKLLVKQGEFLATVGQTGTAAHKELGAKNAHLHLHAMRNGQIVDPFGVKFQGVTKGGTYAPAAPAPARTVEKSFDQYVREAQRLTDAVERYSPQGSAPNKERWRTATNQLQKFREENELAAQALEWIGLEAGKTDKAVSEYGQTFDKLKGQLDVTASLDNLGRPAAEVTGRLEAIRKEALAGAEAEKKRWGETAKYKALLDLAGDAAKKLEQVRGRKPELTDLQREQQQQRDAAAQQRMETSLRAASSKRLQALVDGGVTPEVSLAKWQAAQAEIKRREDAADRETRKREEDAKKAGENRLTAERALADGRLDVARNSAEAVVGTYDLEVKRAGDSAAARLAVEERLGADVLAARKVQATLTAREEVTRLQRERNTAVNATGLTLRQRQDLWAQYGQKIAQVQAALATTLATQEAEAAQALQALQERAFSEENVGKAEAYAARLRATIASLPGQTEEGLITVYGEARAARDQELLKAVYDEWERRRLEAEEDARVVAQLQSEANLSAAQVGVATAEQMIGEGDTEGALQFLSDMGDGFQTMSDQGEDAVDAINLVIDAVNRLAGASAVTDEFNSFVSGLSGTIDEQIGQVADRLAEVTDPAMRAKLQGLLKDLRADLPKYQDPYAAGYLPGSNGFVSTGDAPDLKEAAQARDLGTLLNETTDPAQVQGLMAEVVDLLASEMGKRLPESIRTSLEEGVQGAQGYLDALSLITGDAVVDGWERGTQQAATSPENRFVELTDQLYALRDSLGDPLQENAITEGLEAARAAGELTESQLQSLLELIRLIKGEVTPDLGLVGQQEGAYEDLITRAGDIDQGVAVGKTDRVEAAKQMRALAAEADRYAQAAEAAGNAELAAQFRQAAGAAREAAGVIGTLMDVQEYAGHVQDLAGAFSGLAEATGNEDLAANLNGLGNLAGKVVALAGDIARIVANPADVGAWVGAITKIVSGIGEALNGHRKAYAEAERLRSDFNKRFTLLNGNDYATTTVRSRGWLADTFGGGPEVKQVIDEFGLKLAQTLEESIVNGIKSGFKESLRTGNMKDFSRILRENTYAGVVDGVIEAFFDETLRTILGPAIKAYTDALRTPGTEDDAAALTGLDQALATVDTTAAAYQKNVAPRLADLRRRWGLGEDGTAANRNATLIGAAPTLQTGIPTAVLGIPPELAAGVRNLGLWDVALQNRANQRLIDLADHVISGRSSGAPPPTGLANF